MSNPYVPLLILLALGFGFAALLLVISLIFAQRAMRTRLARR